MRKRLVSVAFVFAILMCGLAVQYATAAPCEQLAFQPSVYFPGGLGTNGVASGDLNGDGNLDLVTANEISGTVVIRFGDGAGGFPTSLQFFTNTPSSVAVADFNHDGHLDFVASNRSISAITVRLGLGGGAFGAPVQIPVGPSPSGIATGDFNRDGNLDIVTANAGSNTISLLLGNAAGSFGPATSVFIGRGSGAFGLVVADLNGDGNEDVATANRGSFNITVLLGNGSGGFPSVAIYPAGIEAFNIAAGDLNGDSWPDLATANLGSNNITVRFNNGLGAFPNAMTLPSGIDTFDVKMGDLNNDGHTDVVATSRGNNRVSVYPGNGDGTFGARVDVGLNSGPRAFIVADLNDDGGIDIAAGVDSGNIAILLNTCSTNSPPTISAGVVTREQDAGSSNSLIATVADGEDDLDDLVVTVNGGASAIVNGVSISNIAVDASGNVTADVSATCAASDATFTLTVTDTEDLSATASLSVTVTTETRAPVINGGKALPDITVYLPLNSPDLSMPVNFVTPQATDNCTASPTVTTSPVSGSTFNVGSTLVNVTATDDAGNTANASFTVNVLFVFGGLQHPLEPFPTLNITTAGIAIPVKFSLSGYKGLAIFAAGYPASSEIACDQNEPGSTIEETVMAGGSELTYDAVNDRYTFIWKTNKLWRDTCRILILRFADGTEQYAKLRFR